MPRTGQGWVVEGLVNLASFTSLVVVVAGFLTGVGWLTALGLAVGGVGVVWPWVAAGRGPASGDTVFLTFLTLGVLVADLATLVVMWFTT